MDKRRKYRWVHDLLNEELRSGDQKASIPDMTAPVVVEPKSPEFDTDRAWDEMQVYIREKDVCTRTKKTYRQLSYVAAVAAVLLVICIPSKIGVYTDLSFGDNKNSAAAKTESKDKHPIKPIRHAVFEETQMILVSTDGKEYQIDQLEPGKAYLWDGLTLSKGSDGGLMLKPLSEQGVVNTGDVRRHELRIPAGRICKVTLPDGTRVQLNASSKLIFPDRFEGERRVHLVGEAYFDVAHDPSRRFIVTSGQGVQRQEIAVYGTKFTVQAFADDVQSKTILLEGSVRFRVMETDETTFLKPLQQLTFAGSGIEVGPADVRVDLAWMDNVFNFPDLPAKEALRQIGRWYGVVFVYGDELADVRIFAQISRDRTLSEIIEVLERANDLHFEFNGKEVIVTR